MKTKRRPAVWVTSALVLQVRNLAIDVAARRVLSDASFTVAAGDKVGLVGRSGAGAPPRLAGICAAEPPAPCRGGADGPAAHPLRPRPRQGGRSAGGAAPSARVGPFGGHPPAVL